MGYIYDYKSNYMPNWKKTLFWETFVIFFSELEPPVVNVLGKDNFSNIIIVMSSGG